KRNVWIGDPSISCWIIGLRPTGVPQTPNRVNRKARMRLRRNPKSPEWRGICLNRVDWPERDRGIGARKLLNLRREDAISKAVVVGLRREVETILVGESLDSHRYVVLTEPQLKEFDGTGRLLVPGLVNELTAQSLSQAVDSL